MDIINKPKHYQLRINSLEKETFTTDVLNILAALDEKISDEGFGKPIFYHYFYSAVAYILRAPFKGTYADDVRKAIFYLKMTLGEDPRNG